MRVSNGLLAATVAVVLAATNNFASVEGALGGVRSGSRRSNIRGVRVRRLGGMKNNIKQMEKLAAPEPESVEDQTDLILPEDQKINQGGNDDTDKAGKGDTVDESVDESTEEIGSVGYKGKEKEKDKLEKDEDVDVDTSMDPTEAPKGETTQGGKGKEKEENDTAEGKGKQNKQGGDGKDEPEEDEFEEDGFKEEESYDEELASAGGKGKNKDKDDNMEDLAAYEDHKGDKGKNKDDKVGNEMDDYSEDEPAEGGKKEEEKVDNDEGQDGGEAEDEADEGGEKDKDKDDLVDEESVDEPNQGNNEKGDYIDGKSDDDLEDEETLEEVEEESGKGDKGKGETELDNQVSKDFSEDEPTMEPIEGNKGKGKDDKSDVQEPSEQPAQAPDVFPNFSEDEMPEEAKVGKKDKDDKNPAEDSEVESEHEKGKDVNGESLDEDLEQSGGGDKDKDTPADMTEEEPVQAPTERPKEEAVVPPEESEDNGYEVVQAPAETTEAESGKGDKGHKDKEDEGKQNDGEDFEGSVDEMTDAPVTNAPFQDGEVENDDESVGPKEVSEDEMTDEPVTNAPTLDKKDDSANESIASPKEVSEDEMTDEDSPTEDGEGESDDDLLPGSKEVSEDETTDEPVTNAPTKAGKLDNQDESSAGPKEVSEDEMTDDSEDLQAEDGEAESDGELLPGPKEVSEDEMTDEPVTNAPTKEVDNQDESSSGPKEVSEDEDEDSQAEDGDIDSEGEILPGQNEVSEDEVTDEPGTDAPTEVGEVGSEDESIPGPNEVSEDEMSGELVTDVPTVTGEGESEDEEFAGPKEVSEDEMTDEDLPAEDGEVDSEDGSLGGPNEISVDEMTDEPDVAAPSMAPSMGIPVITDIPATEPPVTTTDTPLPETNPPTSFDTLVTDLPISTDIPLTDSPATEAPSAAAVDTDAPATDSPATEAPSTATVDTEAPVTEAPSAPPATIPPAGLNRECTSAIKILAGQDNFGSTVESEFNNDVQSCGEALGGASAAPGLWYSIEGTGSGFQATVNATYDMQLSVFEGPACDALACIGGTAGDAFPWTSGRITWTSTLGNLYFIYVNGWEGQVGDFNLVVLEGDIPSNSKCESAIPVGIGDAIEGTTMFSAVPIVEPCLNDEESNATVTSPAAWYFIEGTGEIVLFSVFAGWDAQVSIYTGQSCVSLSCLTTNINSPISGPQAIVGEGLNPGGMYYILVHGSGTSAGEFQLVVETIELAENDDCTGAMELTLGVPENGNTFAASRSEGLPFCGVGSNETTIGLWYSAVGTGSVLEASLNATWSLDFSVYSGGSCANLTCAGYQSFAVYPLDWDTTPGEEYFIHVYGTNAFLRDDFEILLREVFRPENDLCEDAIPLEVGGRAIEGTTSASITETDLELCGVVSEGGYGGVWYSFTGTGTLIMIGLRAVKIEGQASFDSQISLYSGPSCDTLTCVDGNDQGELLGFDSALAFSSEEGLTYYILVHGYEESRGDFTVQLTAVSRPGNDECKNSILLEPSDTVGGATWFATDDAGSEFDMCGASQGGSLSAPGVWYSVDGTGQTLEVSVSATYDVQITVFIGDCSNLICVDGSDGYAETFLGTVLWESEARTTYLILVHGFAGQFGEFELFFGEVNRPVNDACEDAIGLELFDTVAGSTKYSAYDQVSECGTDTAQVALAPGVWYSFMVETIPASPVGVYSLGLSVKGATFLHQVTVLAGDSCNNLVCVAYDDSADTPALVEWVPEENTMYYFAVQGYGEERGDFELRLFVVENVA